MDADFPAGMMDEWRTFFRDVHPTLPPGQDVYPAIFDSRHLYPLQRQAELVKMMQLARGLEFGVCDECCQAGGWYTAPNGDRHLSDLRHEFNNWQGCQECEGVGRILGPRTVMEIGADKGGSLYHWCMSLPTVRSVIACEIRGTPYAEKFEEAFPDAAFCWLTGSSQDDEHYTKVTDDLGAWEAEIDVLFIDGDKLGMKQDFDLYRPLMRKGGLIFIHDIRDDGPREAWEAIVAEERHTEWFVDVTDWTAVKDREAKTPHEAWLQHWAGRSCGVGVVHV